VVILNLTENTFGGVLGIVGTLVGVFVGAVLTYFVSLRIRRKGRLAEGIYEPLLGQVGEIKDKIQDGREMPDLDGFEKTRHYGMYFVMDDEVKKKADLVYQELKDYQTMYNASTGSINKIIEKEVELRLSSVELEKYRDRPYDVDYRGHIAGRHVGNANLRDCLRIGKTPLQFLHETKSKVNDSDIDCLLSGYPFQRISADFISVSALATVKFDSVVQETGSLRNSLLRDLQELIEMLKEKVV